MNGESYLCDKCGKDITRHIHAGRAHVLRPLGPLRYTCQCGQKYHSGAVEWDHLSDWEQQSRMREVGLAIILLVGLALLSLLGYVAFRRRSLLLACVWAALALLSVPLWPLFVGILSLPFEIAASLWRTRIGGKSQQQ